MKKTILSIILVLSALNSLFAKDDRPNIILFLTDDQTRNSIGAYGNEQVKTPNMDKLASNGAIFSNNYATTSICMASRACIMTGMYEYKTGCNFDKNGLTNDKFKKSYPVLLREAGYFTGLGGKFGFDLYDKDTGRRLRAEEAIGFSEFDFFAAAGGQTDYDSTKNRHISKYADKYPHATRAYGAAMQEFLKLAKESGKPFCFSMSFKAPHSPLKPDPFFDDVYKDVVWKRPLNTGRENAKHLSTQAKLGRQYLIYSDAYFSDADFQRSQNLYHQLIHGVDYAIGMVLEELDRQGLADNTIIILTSDNGYSCNSHGFGGKALAYEENSKTPLIIYDPRAKKTDTIWRSALTANIDLAPTILDYAGVEIPANMDGKSLKEVIQDPKAEVRKDLALYQLWGSLPTVSLSIVTKDYKYIYYPYAEKLEPAHELFNLKTDGLELNNVINNPEYKSVLAEMKTYYDEQFKKYKAENVGKDSYETFSVIFDQDIDWQEKSKNIHKVFTEGVNGYENMLHKINYEGDIYDYDAVIEYTRKRLTGEIPLKNRAKKAKKNK